jgi:hypothetical protein
MQQALAQTHTMNKRLRFMELKVLATISLYLTIPYSFMELILVALDLVSLFTYQNLQKDATSQI